MRRRRSIVLLLILALCGSLHPSGDRGSISAASTADEIAISVATDKAVYDYGEPVQVAVTARNITDHPVTLSWPSTCQSRYALNGRWQFSACLAVLTSLTIDVGQAYTWTKKHPETLAPGFYVVVGQVIDYGDSQSRAFAVGRHVALPIVGS